MGEDKDIYGVAWLDFDHKTSYFHGADARGLKIGKEELREQVYGMPYDQWKQLYQRDATPDVVSVATHRATGAAAR